MYSGMAIRMAQELKLNVEPEFEEAYAASGRLSWLEKETRRRLWWSCFVLDRYAGAAADRSIIINEKVMWRLFGANGKWPHSQCVTKSDAFPCSWQNRIVRYIYLQTKVCGIQYKVLTMSQLVLRAQVIASKLRFWLVPTHSRPVFLSKIRWAISFFLPRFLVK